MLDIVCKYLESLQDCNKFVQHLFFYKSCIVINILIDECMKTFTT